MDGGSHLFFSELGHLLAGCALENALCAQDAPQGRSKQATGAAGLEKLGSLVHNNKFNNSHMANKQLL